MDTAQLDSPGRLTRAFVAVDIPEGVRSSLAAYMPSAPGFRWAPASNLHLTIRFCGGVDEATLTALRTALREIRAEPFELRLGGLGSFGGRRPRVIWIGLAAGSEPLGALAAGVEASCRTAGLQPEERPFRAHLTLARATGREPMPQLPEPPRLPAWTARSFRLYESRLGRGPAVYSVIEEFPLSPAR